MTGPSRPIRPALLALHTTEPEGSVALGSVAGCHSRPLTTGGPQSPALLAAVLELVAAAGTTLAALDGIAVTTGPGSFTGIRVGLATAQGLAAARTWQVHACDSLLARAAAWTGLSELLAVVLDARRGEVYAGLYDVRGFPPRVLLAPFCAPPAEAAARLAAAAAVPCGPASVGGRVALTGSGADLVGRGLEGAALRGELPRPVAVALLDLAWGGHCLLVPPQRLEPSYLRKSDAEVRRESAAPPRA